MSRLRGINFNVLNMKLMRRSETTLRRSLFTALLLAASFISFSQAYVPGNSYFGRANYIEYIAGNLPVIISVPHGGNLTPAEIPDRTCGDETVTDSYTRELAESIRQEVHKITGCTPHVIICHLKRTKLDVNREEETATCGNEYAAIAWQDYHRFIDSASASVERISGKGLLIDLHGHGHTIQRLELGYLLSSTQLRYSDAMLDEAAVINQSSIRNLTGTNVTGLNHSALLHGLYSLGTMFEAKGFPAVPGIDEPFPLVGEPYFSGGYITERHGSVIDGTIDAIQIECNHDVRFEETARDNFAAATATVLLDYLIRHYFPGLPQTYCNQTGIESPVNKEFGVYPVPFNEILTVRAAIPCQLSIYNMKGELLMTEPVTGEEIINMEELIDGIYLAVFSINGDAIFRCKIIKGSTGK
jgi:N-formylglutamate amidohydrolase